MSRRRTGAYCAWISVVKKKHFQLFKKGSSEFTLQHDVSNFLERLSRLETDHCFVSLQRSSDVAVGSWSLTADQEKALQSSQKLLRDTFEVVRSSGDLLNSVFDKGRSDCAPLGRPKYRGPPHFAVAVDLESRLEIVRAVEQRARKVLESAKEYNSVKNKLWKLKSEFSTLRFLCIDLETELPRSLREAEFWRSGPLEAQATEMKLLNALNPLTPFLKQASVNLHSVLLWLDVKELPQNDRASLVAIPGLRDLYSVDVPYDCARKGGNI